MQATTTGRVGVIGTVGTIGSGAYVEAIARTGAPVHLYSAACPGFVEFVERGQTVGDEVTVLAERLLAPIREAEVDALLLGCTHYPFLARTISDVMGPKVTLVSSADETAFAAHRHRSPSSACCAHRAARPATTASCRAATSTWFRELGAPLLGPELDHTERVGIQMTGDTIGPVERDARVPRRHMTSRRPCRPTNCARSRSSATTPRWPPGRAW